MKQRRGSTILYGSAVLLATGIAFGAGTHLRRQSLPPGKTLQPVRVAQSKGKGTLPITPRDSGNVPDDALLGMDTFETVYQLVKQNYADPLPADTDTKMSRGAVKAMLAALEDPNSFFLDQTQRSLLEAEAAGKFGGIGAALYIQPQKKDGYTDHRIVVVAPLPDSPAAKAGLKPGDMITRIDGKWVLGYNPLVLYTRVIERFRAKDADEDELEKARQATQTRITTGIGFMPAQMLLRGDKSLKALAEKTSHTLTIERPGAAQPLTLEVGMGTTEAPEVSERALDGGVGYIKIPFFTDQSATAVATASAKLPGKGLVVDLRDNPGGSFEASQKIASLLSGAGTFVVEVGPRGKRNVIQAPAESAARRGAITVLVSRGTASTAEALAASLADRGIGTLAGEKTFGDALVQTLYSLEDGSGFTLVTGKMVSPKGVAWANAGLIPQVAIAPGTPEDQVLARAVAVVKSRPNIAAAPRRP